ncbi:type I 3-dehydroquinate dehydratase [Desulfogranum japonicum]|uniref:type I 3-dehydroquinate dehydratase n=1 Tax=Desulfogranum japonicum TaxID=231447 RepID=UPI0003F8862B|nr:type I 3-dehydroquinate dehydratase [Desulfogranum japonicum]
MIPGKLCVALTGYDAEAIAKQITPVTDHYDVVEIRLDGMTHPDIQACQQKITGPLLFTHRPLWEGGTYRGSEQDRLALLEQAIDVEAAYIDIELETEAVLRSKILNKARAGKTKSIVSHHNFSGTPGQNELVNILRRMQNSGADIGKIITTANNSTDVSRVLSLIHNAQELDFPLITFCMGEAGRISRFATIYMGGFMTYLALDEAQSTAPGQFSLKHFHSLLTLFNTKQ